MVLSEEGLNLRTTSREECCGDLKAEVILKGAAMSS